MTHTGPLSETLHLEETMKDDGQRPNGVHVYSTSCTFLLHFTQYMRNLKYFSQRNLKK
jgi:hypothetical protein